MGITEEEITKLYGDLKGEEFDGTYTDTWESRYSREPQLRDVIETSRLGRHLDEKLSNIHRKLEGQAWKGFIPNPNGEGWKFYVILVGKHDIGAYGKCTIKDFEVFPITEQRQYASRMGISITIAMN